MAYQSIGIGTAADDGTGDTLRIGADKVNDNFLELYTSLGDASSLSTGISANATKITLTGPEISGGATINGVIGGTQTSATITTLSSTSIQGLTSLNIGTLSFTAASITDTSGAISFGNENITTTGTATLATVDINAGAIDGTTIGANSAAAGTFAAITGSSLSLTAGSSIVFEGATDDASETTLAVSDPTGDRTVTLPDTTGTVITTGDTNTVTGTMIAADTVAEANMANDAIGSAELKTLSTLLIKNSGGGTLKTIHGAGA